MDISLKRIRPGAGRPINPRHARVLLERARDYARKSLPAVMENLTKIATGQAGSVQEQIRAASELMDRIGLPRMHLQANQSETNRTSLIDVRGAAAMHELVEAAAVRIRSNPQIYAVKADEAPAEETPSVIEGGDVAAP